ncbi:MAG TPA: glycoside hydrolase family 38 C-terminal domain-containing protein, partial [Gemmatimonadaceae bacterium]|nr:glycoside hydrolase family 38 C-terminal domain-containing protein [Gemmatimonadaceae bacterium]
AIGRRADWRPSVVVRNRAPRARSGVAEMEILTFIRDVPVGPDSAWAQPPESPDEPALVDGGRVPYQVLEQSRRNDRLEPRRHYPDNDLVRAQRVVAWVPEIPGYGTVAFPLTTGAVAAHEAAAPQGQVRTGVSEDGSTWMENRFLRVTHDSTGAILLSVLDGSVELHRFIEIEDVGDAGDTYTPSLIAPVIRSATANRARVVHHGPLRGEMEAEFLLAIPEQTSRNGRAAATVNMAVRLALVIDAEARFLRVRVTCENVARDHRLRLVFGTGVGRGDVYADAAFGPVVRRALRHSPDVTELEQALPTAPLHRYVTCCDDHSGLTVFANGATEYEMLSDGRIAITLFRAVGELSRADLPERPGHAGWPSPTPDAQCLGPIESEMACLPHGPRTDEVVGAIERTADDVLFPLIAETFRALMAPPGTTDGIVLDGAGLAFGACKRSEDGDWMVLRCVNLLGSEVHGSWRLRLSVREARLARLDESPGAVLAVDHGRVAFVASPRAVVTVLVR